LTSLSHGNAPTVDKTGEPNAPSLAPVIRRQPAIARATK
jgi:hypothetical protein